MRVTRWGAETDACRLPQVRLDCGASLGLLQNLLPYPNINKIFFCKY